MGKFTDQWFILPVLRAILFVYDVVPFSNYWTYKSTLFGLLKLWVHRTVMEKQNLHQVKNPMKIPDGYTAPTGPPKARSDDGFGNDWKNPTTAMEGAPIGRNMPATPMHLRDPHGKPDVQLVAQRLLAREKFQTADGQLNVLAASWIQAMVHDWIGHFDGGRTEVLDKGSESLCPFAKSPFKFPNTLIKDDGSSDSERSNWWDASFVYGNNKEQVDGARTFKGGKMLINEDVPHALAARPDGTYIAGDNKNSWVGVALLQDLFIKEHNYLADMIAEKYPKKTDQEIFDYCRLIVAALVAKIHTVDWTVELLKTPLLKKGMDTNWYGLPYALFGIDIKVLAKIEQPAADDKGTPYNLTEEFAAVYRLHSLSPPGLVLGEDKKEFIPLSRLLGNKGREEMAKSPERPREMMKSVLHYPCGALVGSNYPNAYRDFAPTDEIGNDKPASEHIDLASIDLFRDRERGILKFNEFRRQLSLKPYRSWLELTGGVEEDARKLSLIYGPGQEGIERMDLLVGDMYEAKVDDGFALSETSFAVFLLMASRRLDADPFLNEYFDDKHYTAEGKKHVMENGGLLDLLDRHYPDLAVEMKERGLSAFNPTAEKGDAKQGIPTVWEKIIKDETVFPKSIVAAWDKTAADNKKFFDELEEESEIFRKNLTSAGHIPMPSSAIYVMLAVLIAVVSRYFVQFTEDVDAIVLKPLFPTDDIDIARELAFSNVRHSDGRNRALHAFTNPLIYISQWYLMDQFPSILDLAIGTFKLNLAGLYLIACCAYALLLDSFSGVFCTLYLIGMYATVPYYEKWMIRLVGEKKKWRLSFILYLFGQGIQILYGHLHREGSYDWNLFQLFPLQQDITVYNIIHSLNIYPEFSARVTELEPVYQQCKDDGVYFANC